MEPKEDFDCVALKDAIQDRMREEFAGLSDEEQRDKIQRELATSDSIAARKWRMCRDAETTFVETSVV
jgi:hypothetical protein